MGMYDITELNIFLFKGDHVVIPFWMFGGFIIWRCVVPAEIPPLTPVIVAENTANFLAASKSELLVFVVTSRCDIDYSTLISQSLFSWSSSADRQTSHMVDTFRKTRRSTCWKCSKWLVECFLSVRVLCVWIVDINLDFHLAPWIKITLV